MQTQSSLELATIACRRLEKEVVGESDYGSFSLTLYDKELCRDLIPEDSADLAICKRGDIFILEISSANDEITFSPEYLCKREQLRLYADAEDLRLSGDRALELWIAEVRHQLSVVTVFRGKSGNGTASTSELHENARVKQVMASGFKAVGLCGA